MIGTDTVRRIASVEAVGADRLQLVWSDGTKAEINLSGSLNSAASALLRDPEEFATVQVGDWGHSVEWRCGTEIGADSLWLDTLAANGRGDVRQFLEWRLRHGLSLGKAAKALGISRRSVAYYSNGERKVPLSILLACKGWEVEHGLPRAA